MQKTMFVGGLSKVFLPCSLVRKALFQNRNGDWSGLGVRHALSSCSLVDVAHLIYCPSVALLGPYSILPLLWEEAKSTERDVMFVEDCPKSTPSPSMFLEGCLKCKELPKHVCWWTLLPEPTTIEPYMSVGPETRGSESHGLALGLGATSSQRPTSAYCYSIMALRELAPRLRI